jgi:hypothetical protein
LFNAKLAIVIVVDLGYEPWCVQTKDFTIVFFFSAKHTAIRSTNKDLLARNQDIAVEWSDMSIRELLWSKLML